MILICGDSGSGKTTLSELFNLPILECDRYHKWERGDYHWKYYTHLNPRANHIDLMVSHANTIRKGGIINYRNYSHSDGKFTEPQQLPSGNDIVLCGLHTFSAEGIKIFVDTDPDLKNLWKINRDFKERGHSIQTIMSSIAFRDKDVVNYITPQKKLADYVVCHRWAQELITTVYIQDEPTNLTIDELITQVKNENRINM